VVVVVKTTFIAGVSPLKIPRMCPFKISGKADSGTGSEGAELKGVAMQQMRLMQCLYCRNSDINMWGAAW
jgi:hypothetical protein